MKKLLIVFFVVTAPLISAAHATPMAADFGVRDLSGAAVATRAKKNPPICICRSVPGIGQVCTPKGCGGFEDPVIDFLKPVDVDIRTKPAPVYTLPKRR